MLKAYIVHDKYMDNGSTIVWAETSGKAKQEALKEDLFDNCEFIEMYASRAKKYDKYADTKRIPIKELLQDGWWFCCDMCGTDHLDQSDIDEGNAFIFSEDDEYWTMVKGSLICKKCKEKLEERCKEAVC